MIELLKKYKALLLYGIFGVMTTIVNVVSYYVCCSLLKLPNLAGTAIAWLLAVLFAFVTNKVFVFDSPSWEPKLALKEAVSFFGCRIGTGAVEMVLMGVFVDILGVNGMVMKIITNVVVIILNYVLSKVLIFRRPRNDS